MIVCLCHNVNHRVLDSLVESGAASVRDVGEACGAGTDCGQCARDILAHLRKRKQIQPIPPDRVPVAK